MRILKWLVTTIPLTILIALTVYVGATGTFFVSAAAGSIEDFNFDEPDTRMVDDFGIDLEQLLQDTNAPVSPSGLKLRTAGSQVMIDWDSNDEVDLDGYNVYRSATADGGYQKINSYLLLVSHYNDTVPENETDCFYVVTAVDITGNESILSGAVGVQPSPVQ